MYMVIRFKGEGKRFLHNDLICMHTLPEYISGINVDGLCIISVKINFEAGHDFVRHYLFTAMQPVMTSLVGKIPINKHYAAVNMDSRWQSREVLAIVF